LAVHYSRDTFQRRVTLSATERAIKIIRRASREANYELFSDISKRKERKGKKKKKRKEKPDDARTFFAAGCDTGSVRMNLRARDPTKLSKASVTEIKSVEEH